ncbi:hypothetical protein EV361DRAFT_943611 [Lentinula raphanica]|nr:hypothetical protein EV361DRAFT_943611 [Lentinula raphanica]
MLCILFLSLPSSVLRVFFKWLTDARRAGILRPQTSGPTLPSTNLGPIVSLASSVRIRKQVEDAVKAGRRI